MRLPNVWQALQPLLLNNAAPSATSLSSIGCSPARGPSSYCDFSSTPPAAGAAAAGAADAEESLEADLPPQPARTSSTHAARANGMRRVSFTRGFLSVDRAGARC